MSGEAGAVDADAVERSRKTVRDAVEAGPKGDGSAPYPLKDIFNADEFAFFYAAPPSNSLHTQGETCTGGKVSKARLTGMVAVNCTGTDKYKPTVIGTASRPQVRNTAGVFFYLQLGRPHSLHSARVCHVCVCV